jgi:regulator of replication initiation timing
MAHSKKKIIKPVLTEKDKLKAERQALRKALKESGQLSVPVHKVHKNKKKYNRKQEKKDIEENLDQK